MRDDWNIAEEGSGASVEPWRLRLICPKGLLSSSAWRGMREGWMEAVGQQQLGHSSVSKCRAFLSALREAPPKRPPHMSHRPRAGQGHVRAEGTLGTRGVPGVTPAQPHPMGDTIPKRSPWRQHHLAEPTGQPQPPALSTSIAGELWACNLLFPSFFQSHHSASGTYLISTSSHNTNTAQSTTDSAEEELGFIPGCTAGVERLARGLGGRSLESTEQAAAPGPATTSREGRGERLGGRGGKKGRKGERRGGKERKKEQQG